MIKPEKLAFWIEHGFNVLFEGKHGVGKTSMVLSAFEKAGLKYKYYSASTMDPWVDLVGVPKEKTSEDGTSYLDLIRPKEFQDDTVEAIFFDEFNRAVKKTRNAVMELIQFKSINGKVFNNLKVVWAAINPSDANYDVECLDPAQADRFHVKVQLPYEPSFDYFVSKYGEASARSAIAWWQGLPDQEKDNVSPRRLDYALESFSNGGDVRDILPASSNCSKLIQDLRAGPTFILLQKCVDESSFEEARRILEDENQYAGSIRWILQDKRRMESLLHLIPGEKLSSLIASEKHVLDLALLFATKEEAYAKVLRDIWRAGQNSKIVNRIKSAAAKNSELNNILFPPGAAKEKSGKVYYNVNATRMPCQVYAELKRIISTQGPTAYRLKAYRDLLSYIPGPSMDCSAAQKILSVLDYLSAYSYLKTIEKLPHLIGVVNHCVNTVHAAWNKPRRYVLEECSPNLLEKIERSRVLSKGVLF